MPVSGTLFLAIVALVVLLGIVYFVQPDLIRSALHWWQPKWF
jgi:uncharacterized protein YjeT (DUF2065 family)